MLSHHSPRASFLSHTTEQHSTCSNESERPESSGRAKTIMILGRPLAHSVVLTIDREPGV